MHLDRVAVDLLAPAVEVLLELLAREHPPGVAQQHLEQLLPLVQEEGLGVIPYNPLAGGLLTGDTPLATATRAALAALTAAGHTYELRGMIWQQGEADIEKQWSAAYQKNLTDLISRVRKDLSESKPLPFIIGGLSDSQDASIKVPF